MTELPRESDLVWQSQMNVDRTEPVTATRFTQSSSHTTEPVYGMHPKDSDPLKLGDIAEAGKMVDDAFTEVFRRDHDSE